MHTLRPLPARLSRRRPLRRPLLPLRSCTQGPAAQTQRRPLSAVAMLDSSLAHSRFDWKAGAWRVNDADDTLAVSSSSEHLEEREYLELPFFREPSPSLPGKGKEKKKRMGKGLKGGNWKLKVGAARADQFPSSGFRSKGLHPEVAFVGRSNAGKSSLINALLGQKICHTSKTPGRTQQINFFYRLPHENRHIVDLPGYGFARAPRKVVDEWNVLIGEYIRGRRALVRLYTLFDSRRGLKKDDEEFIHFMEEYQVPYQVVLTKADRTTSNELDDCVREVGKFLRQNRCSCSTILNTISSKTGFGISHLRSQVNHDYYSGPIFDF